MLIGPRGLGNTQQYERELALVRQSRDPTFPVVPVILPDTTTDRPFDFLESANLGRFLSRRKSVRTRRTSLHACWRPCTAQPPWGRGAGSQLSLPRARRLPGGGRRLLLRPRQRKRAGQPDRPARAQSPRGPIRNGGGPIRQRQVFAHLCRPVAGPTARARPVLECPVSTARADPAAGIGGSL